MLQYDLNLLIPSALGMICILLITYMFYRINELTQRNELIAKYMNRRDNEYNQLKDQHSEYKAQIDRLFEDYISTRDRILKLNASVENNREYIDGLRNSSSLINKDIYGVMSIISLGLNVEDIKIKRYIPVRIYVSETNRSTETDILNAVKKLLREIEFEIVDDSPAIKGSWIKEWIVRSYNKLTQKEVTDRLKQIEEAAIVKGVVQPMAEVERNRSGGAADLLKSVPETADLVAMVGSTLIIKLVHDDKASVIVKTLTKEELSKIENDPTILYHPADILERITDRARVPSHNGAGAIGYTRQNLLSDGREPND